MNKINTNINTQNLLYISNPEFKIKKLLLRQSVLIAYYKMRINEI